METIQKNLYKTYSVQHIVCGYFNPPKVKWTYSQDDDVCCNIPTSKVSYHIQFLDKLASLPLFQINDFKIHQIKLCTLYSTTTPTIMSYIDHLIQFCQKTTSSFHGIFYRIWYNINIFHKRST
ncbi:hypothetical protein ACFFRR_010681 [Megaselia abdita]